MRTNSALIMLFALAAIAVGVHASPVAAENWVQRSPNDSWIWIDLDSVTQKGELFYFRMDHSAEAGVPPDRAGVYGGGAPRSDSRDAINCTNGDIYSYEALNTNDPVDQWRYGWVKTDANSMSALYIKLICPAKAAATSAGTVETPAPPLVVAASNGDTATVNKLLASGTDPNTHDSADLTALNWAAYKGHLAVVKALVERGAKVDSNANKAQWTPLMNAANGGYTDIVIYLIAHGAKVNLKSTDGKTALTFAGEGHPETAQYLREHGAQSVPSKGK